MFRNGANALNRLPRFSGFFDMPLLHLLVQLPFLLVCEMLIYVRLEIYLSKLLQHPVTMNTLMGKESKRLGKIARCM